MPRNNTRKKDDARIETVARTKLANMSINILDIPKAFRAAYAVIDNGGTDDEVAAAMRPFYETT